ncbi:MAG TPA: DNA-directed RNA polymerase subunit beta [Candidatus Aminicenantes bacterium]|nr:DNA-directed RNA polymerase subunit beta [Candidatus Aminicenantes bacterium]HRY65509.1 DNA-directed RNA polymerase subunit beta [Candidatus Aminicenantes bacterium]
MAKEARQPYRERVDFSKIKAVFPMPDLLDIQTQSYRDFLQMELLPEERKDVGLQAALKDVFPISDFKETTELEFLSYSIGTWECKCGRLKGVENSRAKCTACQTLLPADMEISDKEVCPFCGAARKIELPLCEHCGDRVGLRIKYSPMECIQKGYSYSIPLKLKVQLVSWEKDATTKAKRLKHIKQQEVYFGDIALMTEKGTFIFNGIERVVVSQLQRSPGVFFRQAENKGFYIAKIIPYRGAWVEFEHDAKNLLWVRLDRKKKFLATVFLRALGHGSDEEILRLFHKTAKVVVEDGKLYWEVSDGLLGRTPADDVTDAKGRKVLAPAKKKLTPETLAALKDAGVARVPVLKKDLLGAYSLTAIKGKVRTNEPLEDTALEILTGRGEPFEVFYPEEDRAGLIISTTLKKDLRKDTPSALGEIYRKLRPGEPHTQESAHNLFQSLFFNPQKYNFSRIGRLKFNIKLGLETPLEEKTLGPQDYVEVLKYLLNLRFGEGSIDDIDHLGNRRVRSVGELVENAFRIGLTRMERTIKEKMTITADLAAAMPQDLINSKPVIAALKEFFGSSQLSQFMDQINALAEITHKRRLSALGPGGLSRERAGFEVRDIQNSHYGRICPVETPEGPNIGLISSLSCFARVNEYGFVETPYRKVENGRIIDFVKVIHPGSSDYKIGDIVKKDEMAKAMDRLKAEKARRLPTVEPYCWYLTAWEEEKYNVAQANAVVDDRGRFTNDVVSAREKGNFKNIPREQIHYIDVSPKQLVSLSAALIPFLEHDDANRALMGSNMQRQAVPLIRPEAPLVGTGIEDLVAVGSGDVVVCKRSGTVGFVDAERIIVRVDEKEGARSYDVGTDLYTLTKFLRTNQNTSTNHRPIIRRGDKVVRGQVLADSSCTDGGELALGRNVLCAFMPWRGYNFEDAIIVSEKLIKDDAFTSLHIVEETIEARDTKLGPEEITRDIPNVPENLLRNLDENGIVRIGAHVKSGDILVGKVAPKGETQLSPEEKLLKAIFGEKALDVKDASLYCSPGVEGTIIDVRIFSRRGIEKGPRAKAIEKDEIATLKRNLDDEILIMEREKWDKVKALLKGATVEKAQKIESLSLEKGAKLTDKVLEAIEFEDALKLKLSDDEGRDREIKDLDKKVKRQIEALRGIFKEKVETLKKGDELAPGVIQSIKVFIAMKRRLSVGDKVSGRHGNKGIVAKIVPEEDMPRLPNGLPVEIVLNPLGVPSRMNVGQILETHAGWAARTLGFWMATPVFDGASENEIKQLLKKAGLPESGKTPLYDGMTGDLMDQEVTVGYIYMMKLFHLVDDKIHARSTGPYSLITQQPLGGKAQFGGQRFGEMEVWALEAYGAAYCLQELLTVKSDDVEGRAKIYEAIVKGDLDFTPGLPESVNVLIRELQSLCLNFELEKGEKDDVLPWGIAVPQPGKGEA